jgi:hypothetical protein
MNGSNDRLDEYTQRPFARIAGHAEEGGLLKDCLQHCSSIAYGTAQAMLAALPKQCSRHCPSNARHCPSNACGIEQILSLLSPLYANTIIGKLPREMFEDPTKWGPAIGKYLSSFKSEEPLEDEALFAEVVDPDLMEKEISRSIRLEEAIDRKIKRIFQVKAAKQIFPNMRKNATSEPKLISAAVSANPQPPAITESERTSATQIEMVVTAEKEHSVVEHGMVEVFAKPKWVPGAK